MANTDTFNSGFDMGFSKGKSGKKAGGNAGPAQKPAGAPAKLGKDIKSFKKGGKVRKTTVALLHKGEMVLNKKQAQMHERKRPATKRA